MSQRRKSMSQRRKIATSVATSVAVLLASASMARPGHAEDNASQTAQAANNSDQIPEIIVTAEKRKQKASDVGATITVASGEQLKDLGVQDVSQLSAAVPGFSFAYGQSGNPLFALRGINFNSSEMAAAPTVSVYVNEAALPYSFMTAGAFLDVDHIEVVKGPQGTLFGENSTAGSINVIPVKPTAEFSAGTELSVNNFGQIENDGHVGGAITDTVNARLAYSTTQLGAWQHPYFEGTRDNGDDNKSAVRLLLDWTPTDRLAVSLNVNGNYDRSEQQQPQPRFVIHSPALAADPALLALLTNYPIPTNARQADIFPGFSTRLHNEGGQGVLRAEYSLTDDMKLISITNYVEAINHIPQDLTGTGFSATSSNTTARDHTIAQELRLEGTGLDNRWNYIVGGNFEDSHLDENNEQFLTDFSGTPAGSGLANLYKLQARDGGVFVNSDFKMLPELTLTGGARYTVTREAIQGCSRDDGNGILSGFFGKIFGNPAYVPGGCITTSSKTFSPVFQNSGMNEHNISWREGLNYQVAHDILFYALISRGYKAGVWSDTSIIDASATVPVVQEELTSYEGGTKLALFDRRLTVDASYFYYDYLNKQFETFQPTILGGAFFLKNIPTSKANGLDLDFVARPFSGLTLRGGATFLHTQIGEFLGFNHNSGKPEQFKGSVFSYAPKVSLTYDVNYQMPLTDEIQGNVGLSGSYTSRTFADLGEAPGNSLPLYILLDLRAGLDSSQGWRASIWVHNVTNKYYITSTQPAGDEQSMMAGLPRTFGATVGYEF